MMLGSTYEGTSTFHVEQYVETTKLERGWGDLLLIQKEKSKGLLIVQALYSNETLYL